jgi:outer membrane protein
MTPSAGSGIMCAKIIGTNTMRNVLLFLTLFFGACLSVNAASLLEVYQQALSSDPVFQQAVAQRLADQEAVPISFANLLPNIGVTMQPALNKTAASGPATTTGSYSNRQLVVNATVTQTLFNFQQFANLAGAKASAKQADATFNAAAQSLILRVASAYFAVLQDEDTLRYATANKAAYAKQLDQVNQQYKVGLKTITDVYTAQASYDASSASYIATQTQLANDKENLRAITGYMYSSLAKLNEQFPLISPKPANIDAWVDTATRQNWSIKSAQYANDVSMQNVKQQFAGHLPVLSAQGTYNITTTRNTGGTGPDGSFFMPPGAAQSHNRTLALNLSVPVFQGGQVVAQTKQAQYTYQVTSQKLEQTVRSTINATRQSYLGVIAGISQIKADRQAVKSSQSSYEGLEAQYRVGTATLVDVLNQQQKTFQAQKQYAADRYTYVNNLLSLKQAAGTLSPDDVAAINSWLGRGDDNAENTTVKKTRRNAN